MDNLIIRPETPADYHEAEALTRRAFWNLHVPGCNEHYLVHRLRRDCAFVPELSFVAELEGKIVGAIYFAKARVEDTEVLTFGPLCVEPEMQKKGIGGALLRHTLALAEKTDFGGIIIFGEPDYYPRFGFKTCDNFGITTSGGENFPPFMGYELREGGLSKLSGGKFYEAAVYENLPADEVEEFNRQFPYMEKKVLPGQWK